MIVPVLPGAWLAYVPGAAAVDTAYRALPEGTRERTAVVAQIYPLAATIDVLGKRGGGPPAYSAHRGYGYFAPPPDSVTNMLWVGFDPMPHAMRGYFAECSPRPSEGLLAWLCTGRTTSWTTIWPAIRSR